uniref:Uncharacterized protein n=1 Tax=Cucumis melo TaxID=3656 RepID=A0A9I9EMQ4_CUCME
MLVNRGHDLAVFDFETLRTADPFIAVVQSIWWFMCPPKMLVEDGGESPRYTIDEALVSMGFGKFQILVLAYAGMGWV